MIFCCREATNDSFLAKITSRPILAGLRFRRLTGSSFTFAGTYLTVHVFPRGPSFTYANVWKTVFSADIAVSEKNFVDRLEIRL